MKIRTGLVVLLVPLALTVACGDDAGETADDPGPGSSSAPVSPSESGTGTASASATPTGPVLPACADVWVDGATLPGRYAGCEADGVRVKAARRFCEFGRPLITYADSFYAVTTGVIHGTDGPLKQDPGFRRAMSSCMA